MDRVGSAAAARDRGIAAPRLASIWGGTALSHSCAALRSGLQRHRASRRFYTYILNILIVVMHTIATHEVLCEDFARKSAGGAMSI